MKRRGGRARERDLIAGVQACGDAPCGGVDGERQQTGGGGGAAWQRPVGPDGGGAGEVGGKEEERHGVG